MEDVLDFTVKLVFVLLILNEQTTREAKRISIKGNISSMSNVDTQVSHWTGD